MGRATSLFSTAWDAYMEQPWAIIVARLLTDVAGLALAAVGGLLFALRMTGLASLPAWAGTGIAVIGGVAAAVVMTVLRTSLIAVLHDVLEGEETGWRRMVAVARRRFWSILGAYLLMTGILAAVTAVLFLPAGLVFVTTSTVPFTVVLGALAGIGVLSVSLLFLFLDQALVIHDAAAVDAVRESIGFARDRYVLVLSLFGLMAGLAIAVSLVPYIGPLLASFVVIPVGRLAYTRLYLDEASAQREQA